MKKIGFILYFYCSICSCQIINIPDANFKNKLLGANTFNGNACIGSSEDTCIPGAIDTNGDGEIQVSEAQAVAVLSVNSANISDLTGIEYFTNLEWLICVNNNLTAINLSTLSSLTTLNCNNNQITSLNLSNLTQLELLGCSNNQLFSLNLSNLPHLDMLVTANNHLSTLDFSTNPVLRRVYCGGNLVSSLDFSSNPFFFDLGCRNNPNLTSIKIRNNTTQLFGAGTYYNECWTNVPNLNYICADSAEIPALQSFLAGCGVTQAITIDSACPLGIEDFNVISCELYPNPSHGIFQLNFSNHLSEKATYTVYDMLGKKLLQQELSEGSANTEIDMGNCSQGIYLLNITMGNFTVSKKMVKE